MPLTCHGASQLEEFKAKKAAAARKSSSGSAGVTLAVSPASGASQSAATVPQSPERLTPTSSRQASQDGRGTARLSENGLASPAAEPSVSRPAAQSLSEAPGSQVEPLEPWQPTAPSRAAPAAPQSLTGSPAAQRQPQAAADRPSAVLSTALFDNGAADAPPDQLTASVQAPSTAETQPQALQQSAEVQGSPDKPPQQANQDLTEENTRIMSLEKAYAQLQTQVGYSRL